MFRNRRLPIYPLLFDRLESEFARQDASVKPDAGQIAARRLNNRQNQQRRTRLAGRRYSSRQQFPTGQTAFGFDNIGDALNISPVLLEKYGCDCGGTLRPNRHLSTRAAKTVDDALSVTCWIPKLPKSLTNYDLTGLSTHHATHVIHRFPVQGEYSFPSC